MQNFAQSKFMKTFKIFLGIISVGFTGTFLILSNYFFEYFYYLPSGIRAGTMFYVSLAFLVLAIVCNIVLFIFVLKDKKVTTKLYCTILPLTLLFATTMYYLVVDTSGTNVVRLMSRNMGGVVNIGGVNVSIIVAIIVLYIALLFAIISLTMRPINALEKAVSNLAQGTLQQDVNLGASKEFRSISQGLNQINDNYKQSRLMFDKLNQEYSKYLPQQFVKELGKKSILDLSLGCNIQKEVTSVFIDIRNSTKTSFTLSLEDNFTFINKYLGLIGPIVRKNNGFVDKYLGDGVLAIFLTPESALKACNEIITTINTDSKALGIYSTKVGIGMHTGKVLMGVIGDKKRLSATVIADSVNCASYLEKLNATLGTQLLFTKSTLNSLEKGTDIEYRYIGTFELGRDNKVSVFEGLNGYDARKKNALVASKTEFENAVRCYELGGNNCKKVFEKCLEKEKTDTASKYYLNLIKSKNE